jgi:hypothetical protein
MVYIWLNAQCRGLGWGCEVVPPRAVVRTQRRRYPGEDLKLGMVFGYRE